MEQEDGGEAGMERKAKRIKMEEQNLHSSTWTEPDSSGPQAVTADMVCWSPPSTSPKHFPADSPQTQIHKLQQQQMVSDGKLGRLQHSLQIQKAKLEYQESMLATQKALIDSQASELESLKTMLEEMRRRLLDLEQSHASQRCNPQRVKVQDVAAVPQPPMANLQSVPGSTYIMMLTSSPFQAFPSCLATPGQASPSHTSMPIEASPSHTSMPIEASPSHTSMPTEASPSHKPAKVSSAHKPAPAQVFFSNTSTSSRAFPSHTPMPTQVSPSHTPKTFQVSPSRISTPPQVSPSHTSTPPQDSASHTSTPTLVSASHTSMPPQVSASHTPKTFQVSPSHTSTPPQDSASHTSTPTLVAASHTSMPPQVSASHTSTPSQVSPSHLSTPAQDSNPPDQSVDRPAPVSILPDITLRTLSSDREETLYKNSFSCGQHQPDVYAASVFMSLVPFKAYNSMVKRCNWAGTNGKMGLPKNVTERVHSLVSQRFPNLTVDQWRKIRSRVNERLRCPRKFDRVTPRYGFNYD
ncbi:PREDICTED: mucin-2-like [Cyprinodon variegatus]|uniref:mucin-2-like n=1 Tax=Cyprinodon variegatus TaxID=28743 RepID=UPI000742A8D7|nr:PREDICTED: mucin-2-like [Cyprinodon variegatus]